MLIKLELIFRLMKTWVILWHFFYFCVWYAFPTLMNRHYLSVIIGMELLKQNFGNINIRRSVVKLISQVTKVNS